jgi:leucyl aminopeptidase
MNSTLTTKPVTDIETPLLAVAVTAGAELPAALAPVDQATGGALTRALASGDFKGKRDEMLLVYGAGKARRVLLVGMGKAAEVRGSAIRRAAAVAAKRARALGTGRLAFAVSVEARNGIPAREMAQAAVEGAAHGGWAFIDLKGPSDDCAGRSRSRRRGGGGRRETGRSGRLLGDAVAAGHLLARQLQMQPGNVYPTFLAEQARRSPARMDSRLRCSVRGAEQEG